MSIGGGSAKSSGYNWSAPMSGDLSGLRNQIGGYFGRMLQGGQTGLSTPQGVVGPAFQNLFGGDPSTDYLGARGALERNLSGMGFQNAYEQAFGAMQPGLERAIDLSNLKTLGQATPAGLRFSTDLAKMRSQNAQDILLGGSQQAMGAGLGAMQAQGQQALDLMGLIGQLGESQLARQLPLLIQYATNFSPLGNFGTQKSSSWNANAGLW